MQVNVIVSRADDIGIKIRADCSELREPLSFLHLLDLHDAWILLVGVPARQMYLSDVSDAARFF
jgi:hypothetical protein